MGTWLEAEEGMDFGLLPPEINSGRIYSGPGPAPLLAAAAGWNGMAAELHSASASYGAAIAELRSVWHGPSAAALAEFCGFSPR